MDQLKKSVIIPTLKRSKLLLNALKSGMSQQENTEYEVLFILFPRKTFRRNSGSATPDIDFGKNGASNGQHF
jgi:hypothetical protein